MDVMENLTIGDATKILPSFNFKPTFDENMVSLIMAFGG